MKEPALLYLIVGLPGAGKTTKARQLEAEASALRLTPDEWKKTLFGRNDPAKSQVVYVPVDPETQRKRVQNRLAETPDQTWPMSEEELTRMACVLSRKRTR